MNEQQSKKILFNKSTLFSLKAELLKKQEEIQEKKHLPQHNIFSFKPSQQSADKKSKSEHQPKRTLKDNLKEIDTEELEACRKSKLALERKAELYEHLSDGTGNSQLAGQFLVDFKGKKKETTKKESEPLDNDEILPFCEDDSEWIEFTDFLGRTRKCLKSDLEYYKKRDEELKKVLMNNSNNQEHVNIESKKEDTEKPMLVQKTNDYLQSLREKWEEKEKELLAKDKDIHYQDLLFDEARIHGVGYYSFSTDETERRKQMEELIKSRQETLDSQKKAEEIRKKRDDLIAARVAAARARQRVRAGLPPEDPEEKKKDFTTCLLEFLNQQKNEADKKAKEEEKRIRDEKEKERQKLRDAYIRDWDIGKDDVEGRVKKFREMSQEEYVEQQRSKRFDEFAPFTTNNDEEKSKYNFDLHGKKVEPTNKGRETKTWSDVRPVKTPPPPSIGEIGDDEEQKGLYFSTRKAEKVVKYKNFVKAQEATPIVNELSDDESKEKEIVRDQRKLDREHAEIAPPPTYDYYGPVHKHRRLEKPFRSDMRQAMAQGSKSLELKESNRKLPEHYDFTFD